MSNIYKGIQIDDLLTIRAKLVDFERMNISKNGNPNFKLKFHYLEDPDQFDPFFDNARVMYVYTQDDYSVNNTFCNYSVNKVFDITVDNSTPKYKLSTAYQLN